MKRLGSFTLEGNGGKWWDVIWPDDKKLLGTWTEFEAFLIGSKYQIP